MLESVRGHYVLRSSILPKELYILLRHAAPSRKTTIFDVGANPVNRPPYHDLRRLNICQVVGFEPEESAFAELERTKLANEVNYNLAVGDGQTHLLNLYVNEYMTSFFQPYFPGLGSVGMVRRGRIRDTIPVKTVALDSVPDLPICDLLKIDIQGAEKLAFEGARETLKNTVAVIVEHRYHRLYLDEPMLGQTDQELTDQGFRLHKFMFNKSKMLANSQSNRLHRSLFADQLIDGDAVYLRNISEPGSLTDDQLKQMSILACAVIKSHSLVLYCLDELVRRHGVPEDLPQQYVDALPSKLRRE